MVHQRLSFADPSGEFDLDHLPFDHSVHDQSDFRHPHHHSGHSSASCSTISPNVQSDVERTISTAEKPSHRSDDAGRLRHSTFDHLSSIGLHEIDEGFQVVCSWLFHLTDSTVEHICSVRCAINIVQTSLSSGNQSVGI